MTQIGASLLLQGAAKIKPWREAHCRHTALAVEEGLEEIDVRSAKHDTTNRVKKILSYIIIIPIKLYQWTISPFLGKTCRYEPTCSWYMLLAIKEWGPFKGLWLGLKRVSRCHPWGGSGYDPVPKNQSVRR